MQQVRIDNDRELPIIKIFLMASSLVFFHRPILSLHHNMVYPLLPSWYIEPGNYYHPWELDLRNVWSSGKYTIECYSKHNHS